MLTVNEISSIKTLPEARFVTFDIIGDANYPAGGYEIDLTDQSGITDVQNASCFPQETDDTPALKCKLFPHESDSGKMYLRLYDSSDVELIAGADVSDFETKLTVMGSYRK